jgi:hypothetical protein
MTMTMAGTDAGAVADDGGRRPDPEVPERARRRTFTAAYKQEILAAYEAAPDGEKGAILWGSNTGMRLLPADIRSSPGDVKRRSGTRA